MAAATEHIPEEVHALLATLAQTLGALLAAPLVACAIGIASGVGLLALSRVSFRMMRPEAPEAGLALITMMLLVRMGIVAGVLLGYRSISAPGFLPFAISLAGGFLVAYTVELLRYAKLLGTGSVLRARSTR